MIVPTDNRPTVRPAWSQHNDRTVLGTEVDHLRLYGMSRADIARRLGCSEDAVAKWIKRHPEPRESWEVGA